MFFVNSSDQNIHAIDDTGAIRPVTGSGAGTRYADLCADLGRGRLLAVTEVHGKGDHPVNALAAVSMDSGQASILHQGHDFYASPTVSPSGSELLFIAWDHPNMPWDGTQLLRAGLEGADIGGVTVVAGGASESVLQPTWLDDGTVLYLSDVTGFWNLHCLDSAGARVVLEEAADYAGPPWQFGNRDYAVLNERFVAARRHSRGEQDLVLIDLESGFASPLPDECAEYSHLSAHGGKLFFLGVPWRCHKRTRQLRRQDQAPHHAGAGRTPGVRRKVAEPAEAHRVPHTGRRAGVRLAVPARGSRAETARRQVAVAGDHPWRAYRSRIAQAAPAAAVLYEPRLGGRRHQLPGQHRATGGATATP